MIELINASKYYKTGKSEPTVAAQKINLTIKKGEMVAIVGTSGAGKTTLLKIIGLLENLDDGEYYFNGKNITNCSDKLASVIRSSNITFVMQDFALINQFTVLENIALPILLSNKKINMKEITIEIQSILGLLDMEELINTKVSNLSGGEKQRVAIARAIIVKPDVILADEPTGALDSKNGNEIVNLLKTINDNGTTVITVTHDMKIAGRCNRIIEISDGRIISDNQ